MGSCQAKGERASKQHIATDLAETVAFFIIYTFLYFLYFILFFFSIDHVAWTDDVLIIRAIAVFCVYTVFNAVRVGGYLP